MTYNAQKPDPGKSPKLDASIIRTNFAQFASIYSNTILGVIYNHSPLNGINQGNHESIIIKKQTQDPGVNNNLCVLYCKDVKTNLTTEPELFVQIPKFLPNSFDTTNAENTPMQLTYNQVNIAGPQYQSFLPGGYLIYFGTDSGNTTPNVLISDTITLSPAPTKILMAYATPNQMTTLNKPFSVSTTILNTTQFTIDSTSNQTDLSIPYSFTWMAIALQ